VCGRLADRALDGGSQPGAKPSLVGVVVGEFGELCHERLGTRRLKLLEVGSRDHAAPRDAFDVLAERFHQAFTGGEITTERPAHEPLFL
jgi:hypothetical protein